MISSRDEENLSQTAGEIREETGAEVEYRVATFLASPANAGV